MNENEMTLTVGIGKNGHIAINENPVSLTEPTNHYMNENAVITTKVFDSSVFELGKAYRLRYSDGKTYTETYEALLVYVSTNELRFNYYDTKRKELPTITLGVERLRENENGEGWDIWKMVG